MVATNWNQQFIAGLENLILSAGGEVPEVSEVSNFEQRTLELLGGLQGAIAGLQGAINSIADTGLVPPVGTVAHVPYQVSLAGGLWQDAGGWLWYPANGASIGAAASGAAVANTALEALFKSLWPHLGLGTAGWSLQTSAGGAASTGASADADWAAQRRLVIPDMRGRAILSAGQGAALTNRAIGSMGGAETHALQSGEMQHKHRTAVGFDSTNFYGWANDSGGTPKYGSEIQINQLVALAGNAGVSTTALRVAYTDFILGSPSSTPHNNMSPWKSYTELWFTGAKA
ncbi:MAG: hypothetical protein F6K04_01335 [Leptolyngbya sp. SIO4C5]|nr:hypothetical protein [Leptolyngbya sp. SIO4C5]